MRTLGQITFPYALQPGRTIVERNDGTLEGTCTFQAETDNLLLLPQIGDPHPDDNRLELHTRDITWVGQRRLQMVGHYLGLRDDPTDKILSYIGNPDRERIETHPDFADFAGTPSAPLNGALFTDPETGLKTTSDSQGVFDSFADSSQALYGILYWLRPSTQVTLTWWQTAVPDLSRRGLIVDNISPFKKPDDVTDFLIIDIPYRQIGSHYQVSEIYLGSGSGGWSSTIYPQT